MGGAGSSCVQHPPSVPKRVQAEARRLAQEAVDAAADHHWNDFLWPRDLCPDDEHTDELLERARACAYAAYACYRADVFKEMLYAAGSAEARSSALAFSEEWLNRPKKLTQLLFDVAFIQFEPEYDVYALENEVYDVLEEEDPTWLFRGDGALAEETGDYAFEEAEAHGSGECCSDESDAGESE